MYRLSRNPESLKLLGPSRPGRTVWGGADKSLARPTSRWRRTESIVSLERRACSCAELEAFSCYRGWKEACQATSAISATSRRELSSSIFFFLQDKTPKKIHAILKETLGEHAPSYVTVKNWVAQFKPGDFSTCDAPRPGRPKKFTTPEIIDEIHVLILKDRRISVKSIAEQLGISRERVGCFIPENLDIHTYWYSAPHPFRLFISSRIILCPQNHVIAFSLCAV